jgi:diguanylate cyclase (GGDEF)-like protein
MRIPIRLRVFVWSSVVLAAVVVAVSVVSWHGNQPKEGALVFFLTAMAAIALHFHVTVTPRYKVDLAPAIYFASVLLFGLPAALGVVIVSRLAGESVLCLRRNPVTGKPRRNVFSMCFNVAHLVLATAAGGAVYFSVLPEQSPAAIWQVENVWMLPLAAAAMFLVESAFIAMVTGLQLDQRPLDIWLAGRRKERFYSGALYLLGLITAIGSIETPWAPVLMVAPAGIVYLSLRKMFSLVLVEQTVTAVEAMADIVDMRDAYTFEHSKRVASYAVQIAQRMGLPPEEVETIRLAARVHDLGKIGVPDRILLKPGPLEPAERAQVEKHPEIGYQILARFPEYRHGKELVLTHHERFDGSGYPAGRSGAQLKIGAQIISVADALDAMTSERPYRRALTVQHALAVFGREKGAQWHPEVVQALEMLLVDQAVEQAAGARESAVMHAVSGVTGPEEPVRFRLAQKLELRPASLEALDYEVASAILASIEKLDRRLKKLDQEAAVDELTGVLRRRAGLAALDREVARAQRTRGSELALAFIDVDGLKAVNDTLGHAAGDRLLQAVSRELKQSLRRQDLVFRYGGDEFVCALSGINSAEAWQKLEEVKAKLLAHLGRQPFSIGLAALRDGETAEQLVARADGALYAERRLRRSAMDEWSKATTVSGAVGADAKEWLVIDGAAGAGGGI